MIEARAAGAATLRLPFRFRVMERFGLSASP
jgi:hypothetical protein